MVFNQLQSLITLIYFDVQIVLNLTGANPFEQVSVSFCHVFIVLVVLVENGI